ncbi:MAG: hypothetical protein HQK83_14410 [Fibrobacteria bacterium]|nr:hypothetical protein [Fibrobacteria bacterium]
MEFILRNIYRNVWRLLLVVMLVGEYLIAQPQEIEFCRDDSTGSNPLLHVFRNNRAFSDSALHSWGWWNYTEQQSKFPAINGVRLQSKINPGNEYVDRSTRAGVSEKNILAGLAYARSIALLGVPDSAVLLPDDKPLLEVHNFKSSGDPVAPHAITGYGWAWNSLKYIYEHHVYEIVFFYHGSYDYGSASWLSSPGWHDGEIILIADNAAALCNLKLSPPVADPAGQQFDFRLLTTITHTDSNAVIYYRFGTDDFVSYTGLPFSITDDVVLEMYAEKNGLITSDTVSEAYTKNTLPSEMVLTTITGKPLGGKSGLTENDSLFIVTVNAPYATLDSISVLVVSSDRQDSERVVITRPKKENDVSVFTDTLAVGVRQVNPGNGELEVSYYDSVHVSWKNPLYSDDSLVNVFPISPAPKEPRVYFADQTGVELTSSLSGTETELYVVVEDMVFDSSQLRQYRLVLTNKKGEGNGGPVDEEVLSFTELSPGRYLSQVNSAVSPPVKSENGMFEIRPGDELIAQYQNLITLQERRDYIGYGVPTQQPGLLVFTNEDGTIPAVLMAGNNWDVANGQVHLQYRDDYVASIQYKLVNILVTSTDNHGRVYTDAESIRMERTAKQGDVGIWSVNIPLDDGPEMNSGNGVLDYYFSAVIQAEVVTHKAGNVEIEDDTSKASLKLARENLLEQVEISNGEGDSLLLRSSELVKICVFDQIYSQAKIDTLLLDKIECISTGDNLANVQLVQLAADSNEYCGMIDKREALSGSLMDTVLHCQDIDNIKVSYKDALYATTAVSYASITDTTLLSLQFVDSTGNSINTFNEYEGDKIHLRLSHKTPGLYTMDTLSVALSSNSGDVMSIELIETGINTGIFLGDLSVAFSETPQQSNSLLEGKLNPDSKNNIMVAYAKREDVTSRIEVISAYIPAERAWIVDGNGDGQGDSVYIRFTGYLPMLPASMTSIDWPTEGGPGHTALCFEPGDSFCEIGYVNGDSSLIAVLLNGSLDSTLGIFPQRTTGITDKYNSPRLTLPAGKLFQGQDMLIQDGMGPVVTKTIKNSPVNSYYYDTDGNVLKQPDTLLITLSEKLKLVNNAGRTWDSLFLFMPSDGDPAGVYSVISLEGTTPSIHGSDSLEWQFIIDNSYKTMKPMLGDYIFLNDEAPYTDASLLENTPVALPCIIEGTEYREPLTEGAIYVPVVGLSPGDPRSIVSNMYYDDYGKIQQGRDLFLVENSESGSMDYVRMWIAPPGLRGDGTVEFSESACQGEEEHTDLEIYPENCLSSVQVFSMEAYTARIIIFDHMGMFVHQSIQYFGKCGELYNTQRRTPRGLQSWLVWNQRDPGGDLVGTGVYFWHVKFTTAKGSKSKVYRQGVVRAGSDPGEACAK